jgi:exopolyphosphatase/guanosine-5'-triphosphate,3'-diphosphate pyrophosphatase
LKTLAAIDAGSNSVLLLIAEVRRNGSIRSLCSDRASPRLSAGLAETGEISTQSVSKLISVMRRYERLCRDYAVDDVQCYGTSAMRRASNAKEVKRKVLSETGIRIRILTGKREAALSHLGATTGMTNLRDIRVTVDAGGGSTEIVVGHMNRIKSLRSLEIGAVALTEKYATGTKLGHGRTAAIEARILNKVSRYSLPDAGSRFSVILSGGTPTTIQAFRLGLREYRPDLIHGAMVSISEYRKLVYELASMSLRERRGVTRYDPGRAQVIVAGGLLTLAIAEHLGAKSVKISDRGLRHGMLLEMSGREPEFS